MAQPSPRTYSPEAAQAILAEAVARQAAEPFTHEHLLDVAAEMSISPDLLAQVEQDWQQQQRQQVNQLARRRQFRRQIATYAAVNTGLIVLNIASAGAITWAIYPLLGWGLGLCFGGCHKDTSPDTVTP